MKLKGVNPFQQHVEKIVLGIVLIILLGVISLQFVTQPNVVKDSGRTIAPAQVFTSLESQANQLQSQISDLSPALPDVQPVDLVRRYDSAFENAGATRLTLSSPLGQGVDISQATGTDIRQVQGSTSGPVAALNVPKTSTPIVASQWATLDPYAVEVVPEYVNFIPAQQPFDFASISIEATFSGTDLEAVLTGESGGKAIPRRFWSATGIAIMGFEAERQRLLPDGSWGDSEPIVTPPHTPVPTNAISSDAGLQELVTVIGNAARAFDDVVRPMFPPTIAGSMWTPPSERVDSGDSSESDQIKRIKRQLERARAELDRMTNTQPDPRNDPGGGKTGRDPRPRPQPGNNDRNQERIEKVRERIADLENQLKDLGVEEEDSNSVRIRTSASDTRSVLEEESIDLWAHDLGVEPGATYRYRSRVVVNNPLFRKSAELDPDDDDQQALARDPFARGSWSDWSVQVVAGAREYFFVTSAGLGDVNGTAPGRTSVELYKMYYGHYRKSTLNVSPGDMLSSSVRISGDLLAFDTEMLPVEEASKAVEALSAEGTPSNLPDGISELPGRVRIDMGVFVLDVYPGQEQTESGLGGQSESVMRVVLRSADGDVVVRTEQGDESSLAYALASNSASEASTSPLRAPGEPAISPSAALFEPAEP